MTQEELLKSAVFIKDSSAWKEFTKVFLLPAIAQVQNIQHDLKSPISDDSIELAVRRNVSHYLISLYNFIESSTSQEKSEEDKIKDSME